MRGPPAFGLPYIVPAFAAHPKVSAELELSDRYLGPRRRGLDLAIRMGHALDASTRISMRQLLEWVWHDQGLTAILMTYNVAEAATLADQVLMIEGSETARPPDRSTTAAEAWFRHGEDA